MGENNLLSLKLFLGMETTTNIFVYICSNSKEREGGVCNFPNKGDKYQETDCNGQKRETSNFNFKQLKSNACSL